MLPSSAAGHVTRTIPSPLCCTGSRSVDGYRSLPIAILEDASGILSCDERGAKPIRAHRYGYSGCGYTLDTGASSRGLDVYRVPWTSASSYGFCVMPLERFLGGA